MDDYQREIHIDPEPICKSRSCKKSRHIKRTQKIKPSTSQPIILKPQTIIILDDSNDDLKSNAVQRIIEYARHYRCKIFISTQHIHNIPPCIRVNSMYYILGYDIPKKKIELIADEIGINEQSIIDQYNMLKPFDILFVDRKAKKIMINPWVK